MWCLFIVLVGCIGQFVAGADEQPFEVVVGIKQQNLREFESLFWKIADPNSPEYLKHRNVTEIAQIIGGKKEDIQATIAWLLNLGAVPSSIKVSSLRDSVTATFSTKPIEEEEEELWTPNGFPLARAHPVPFDFVLRRDILLTPPKPKNKPLQMAPKAKQSREKSKQPLISYNVENQKKAYGIPADLQTSNDKTLQMVWGPGTFGYSKQHLASFKSRECPLLNMDKVEFDTENHGREGGDNFGEGNLDTEWITAMGLNVRTLVSNTNTSSSTEEGNGFGQALLDFATELSSRTTKMPQVLSMSLGSLSAYSCDLLCSEAVKMGHSLAECSKYMQEQRQVCMYLSQDQVGRISTAFQVLGVRGVSIFGSSGDGGSHFSFGPFRGGALARDLNTISCKFQIPVYPTGSPYVISVGGTEWDGDISRPIAWPGGGGGFSWQFAMPDHQKKTVAAYISGTSGVPPASSYNQTGRAYPDVSAIAVSGTSQSCPTIAGLFSQINDHRFNNGLPALGFVAPRIWQVSEKFPGQAFQDITRGNTKTSCNNGFPATKGWDPTTGWGRPIWDGMLKHFGSDDFLSKSE